jgi:hypothetical protein
MKKFQEILKEYRSEFKSDQECINFSNDFFNKNYLSTTNKYSEFSFPFVPGKIYSFFYSTETEISKRRKFINRNPIFLFINYSKTEEGENIVYGIDLSVIPDNIRSLVLNGIWDTFTKEINSDKNVPLPLSTSNLESILRGTGYKNSMFGFKFRYFNNLREVKSKDWAKIPFLELNTFEGLNSFEIYKEYKLKLK